MSQVRILDRSLNTEERQWIADLQRHPGFLLLAQVVGELMQQDLVGLTSSKDMQALSEFQGKYNRGKEIMELPLRLLEMSREIQGPNSRGFTRGPSLNGR